MPGGEKWPILETATARDSISERVTGILDDVVREEYESATADCMQGDSCKLSFSVESGEPTPYISCPEYSMDCSERARKAALSATERTQGILTTILEAVDSQYSAPPTQA